MAYETLIYRIDGTDTIVFVSDNWRSFASENPAKVECGADSIVGRSLWDFIEGGETRHLYQELFKKVRKGNPSGPIPLRCDTPAKRMFLQLNLRPLPDQHIEITSTIVKIEERDPVNLLDDNVPRSKEFIRICSMCKKIAIRQNTWVEIEKGLEHLKPFEAEQMPQLTHGMCPDCQKIFVKELEAYTPADTKQSIHKKKG